MLSPQQRWELSSLIGHEIAGDSTPADRNRLQALLVESQEARRYYYRTIALHAELSWGHGKRTIDERLAHELGSSMPVGRPASAGMARMPKVRLSSFVAAIAVSLLLVGYFIVAAAYVAFRHPSSPVLAESERSEQHATESVPRISVTRITGTADPGETLPLLGPVRVGKPLSIASGIVELRLTQGVRLLVEGPADWTINGKNNATLRRGKLLATVPHEAIGFTVKTPTTEIVDLGTEFGVEVSGQGETKTHVFRGEIRVERSVAITAPAAPSIKLTAGQAVSVDRSGKTTFIEPLASSPAEFIRPPAPAVGEEFNPEVLSPYARYAIDKTKPVAYWDFSWYRNSMKITEDRVKRTPFELFIPTQVGVLGPAMRDGLTGFGRENPAIWQQPDEFRELGLRCRLPGLPATGYSVALWIQPTGPFDGQPHYYLLGNGRSSGSLHDGVRDSLLVTGAWNPAAIGKLGYFDGHDHKTALQPAGKTTLISGTWYSVVLVRRPGKALVYLNGTLELEVEPQSPDQPGDLFSFGHRTDGQSNLAFHGQYDEAAIWDRPLSAEEVAAMYRRAIGEPAEGAANNATPLSLSSPNRGGGLKP